MNIVQGAKTGKDNGYTMLFDIESFDYSYYDEGSEGLKLALVHHLDMPIMRQKGFHIAPGRVYIAPGMVYITPGMVFIAPSKVYIAPGRIYIAPGRVFIAPGRVYIAPGRVYIAPGIRFI